MQKALGILLSLVVVGPAAAQARKTTKPRAKPIRTVYVEGENRAARLTRDLIPHRTCLHFSPDEAKADAVLTIDQQEGTWSDGSRHVGVLGFLRDKRGREVWRARQFIQDDSSGQGTVMAVDALLKNLNNTACGKTR
jgi:hypothetical protein